MRSVSGGTKGQTPTLASAWRKNDLSFAFCRMSPAMGSHRCAVVVKETNVVGNDPQVSRGV